MRFLSSGFILIFMNTAQLAAANLEFANDNNSAAHSYSKSGKSVKVRNVKAKDWVQFGKKHIGEVSHGKHVDAVIGESVTLFGTQYNLTSGPKSYSITFKIGDRCEYDSYNAAYTGPIVAITATGVSVRDMYGNVRRLSWDMFSFRNWDYSAEKIAERNSWVD